MKEIKCPLCGSPLKLSTIESKGKLHFFACYKCNYQLRMSPHKDFALEYAKAFVSLFPPQSWQYITDEQAAILGKEGSND